MDLPLSMSAAFTTMALTGVVLTLPNSPGLVGQFHAAIKLGLAAYLPLATVNASGMAYAIVLHGIQTLWYVAIGLGSLLAISGRAGRHASLAEAVRESSRAASTAEAPRSRRYEPARPPRDRRARGRPSWCAVTAPRGAGAQLRRRPVRQQRGLAGDDPIPARRSRLPHQGEGRTGRLRPVRAAREQAHLSRGAGNGEDDRRGRAHGDAAHLHHRRPAADATR